MPPPLCRYRLDRILRILYRYDDGGLSVREFSRRYGVAAWEVEQAVELGCVKIETRKPPTGRPSRIAKVVSRPYATELPLHPLQSENPIQPRHRRFALESVCSAIKGGRSAFFRIQPYTDAYLRAFPTAKKRRAATASMSRLLRRPDVIAMRQWLYAQIRQEIPQSEVMPQTVSAIWQSLCQARSKRAGPAVA